MRRAIAAAWFSYPSPREDRPDESVSVHGGLSPPAYPVFLPKTGDLALMVFQPKKSYAPDQAWTSVWQTLHSNLPECLCECSSRVAV